MSPASSLSQASDWLQENGPKELESLFRAIIFYPSAPVLVADNDRNYRDASVGAGKLLGLSRDQIIGRQMDDFAVPGFKPEVSELWQSFLKHGEHSGTLQLMSPDGNPRNVEYVAKENILPVRHLLVLHDKTAQAKNGHATAPLWVQDYALYLLDTVGNVAAWYAGASRIYGYSALEAISRPVALLIGTKIFSPAGCGKNCGAPLVKATWPPKAGSQEKTGHSSGPIPSPWRSRTKRANYAALRAQSATLATATNGMKKCASAMCGSGQSPTSPPLQVSFPVNTTVFLRPMMRFLI